VYEELRIVFDRNTQVKAAAEIFCLNNDSVIMTPNYGERFKSHEGLPPVFCMTCFPSGVISDGSQCRLRSSCDLDPAQSILQTPNPISQVRKTEVPTNEAPSPASDRGRTNLTLSMTAEHIFGDIFKPTGHETVGRDH
jgi:hypothetical protein